MTSVIEFSKWQRGEKTPITHFGPAQLVMFTGVRVERLEPESGTDVFVPALKASKNTA
jgi:hypothetical protein